MTGPAPPPSSLRTLSFFLRDGTRLDKSLSITLAGRAAGGRRGAAAPHTHPPPTQPRRRSGPWHPLSVARFLAEPSLDNPPGGGGCMGRHQCTQDTCRPLHHGGGGGERKPQGPPPRPRRVEGRRCLHSRTVVHLLSLWGRERLTAPSLRIYTPPLGTAEEVDGARRSNSSSHRPFTGQQSNALSYLLPRS